MSDLPFRIEFWSDLLGKPHKHRARHYKTVGAMRRAGLRWENRGPAYYCLYQNGTYQQVSAARQKLIDQRKEETPMPRTRRGKPQMQIYSIFGQCDMVAAEIMIKDGKIRKIPQDEIPDTALYNDDGHKAQFAVMVPPERQDEFNNLCAQIRA